MKTNVKILSFLAAVVLLFSAVCFPVSAKSLEELENEYDRADQLIDEYQDKIDKNNDKAASQEATMKLINEQLKAYDKKGELIQERLAVIQGDLDVLNTAIDEYQGKIDSLTEKINTYEIEIDRENDKVGETQELLKKRLRADYMSSETSELEIFLGASSFEDFLTRTELLRQVSKRDSSVMTELKEQINTLNAKKAELDTSREALESEKKALDDKKVQQDAKKAQQKKEEDANNRNAAQSQKKLQQANEYLDRLDKQNAQYEKFIADQEAYKAQISKEIDGWVSNNGSSGSGNIDPGNSGGNHNFRISSRGMIAPMQDKTMQYSARFASHSARGSAAVDFTAPMNRVVNGKIYNTTKGAKLYAVASGTVIKTDYMASGYGNYIIIDHGNGVSTLYGHCDSLTVRTGQRVKQGDVIGAAGNTGNCIPRPSAANPVAGSHLHFEVRVNGVRKNPELYMPSPLV